MAANTQETILFTFQTYFCQTYKDLMFQTFGFFPYVCLLSEDILQYLREGKTVLIPDLCNGCRIIIRSFRMV